MEFKSFGEFAKHKRLNAGMTLRKFCKRYRYNPGNISKIERGIISPPIMPGKLERYAKCLGILKGTEEWNQFSDMASICAGKIPQSVLSDKELVAKLPLIFKAFRELSNDELCKLASKIKDEI